MLCNNDDDYDDDDRRLKIAVARTREVGKHTSVTYINGICFHVVILL
jgi:hypothetical protein